MPHAAYAVVVRGTAFFCRAKDQSIDLRPIRLSLSETYQLRIPIGLDLKLDRKDALELRRLIKGFHLKVFSVGG